MPSVAPYPGTGSGFFAAALRRGGCSTTAKAGTEVFRGRPGWPPRLVRAVGAGPEVVGVGPSRLPERWTLGCRSARGGPHRAGRYLQLDPGLPRSTRSSATWWGGTPGRCWWLGLINRKTATSGPCGCRPEKKRAAAAGGGRSCWMKRTNRPPRGAGRLLPDTPGVDLITRRARPGRPQRVVG